MRILDYRGLLRPCISMLSLFLILLVSCEQDEQVVSTPADDASLSTYYQFLEEATGYNRADMVYDKANDRFLIHDDMIMPKSAIDEYLSQETDPKSSAGGRTEQRRHDLLLNDANARNFRYFIDGNVPAGWRNNAIQALSQWNSTGSKLHLVQVSSASQANIRVFLGAYDDANWVARATLPVPNGTGTVEINPKFNSMSDTQKLFAMVHEMGHNLGFWHTDQTTGTIIPGTPASDPNSVMNSYVRNWTGFSNYDLIAVRTLYPASGNFSRTIEAESYSAMAGVQLEGCSEGGQNVGWIDAGDWMAYNNINIPTSGSYRIAYRVASLNGGGRVSIDLNAGAIVLGERGVPSTGGWQNWTTVTHDVTISAGTYAVGIYAPAGGWNLNWFSITKL